MSDNGDYNGGRLSIMAMRQSQAERIATIESELKSFSKSFETHLEQDREMFKAINEKLDKLGDDVKTILLSSAKREGREEAIEETTSRLSRSEGGKWGAIVGGFIAGIVWAIKALIGGP